MEESQIIRTEYSELMKKSYIDYAMSVIISRALPDVRDGLKPVQRRTLYDMYELGIRYDRPYRKCARIVGDTMGKYHPHGDSSIYEALVVMAQEFKKGMILVDGHGNFGSIEGDGAAAMRYTEARLAKITQEAYLADLDKDIIDFVPNFDETEKEPAVLPVRIPNLLLNGAEGIAVGMATSIPTHNLGEIVDAVKAYMKNNDITTKQLMKYIKGPDFPTGGIVVNKDDLAEIYETGTGKIKIRGKVDVEEIKGGRKKIVISEIPYTMIGAGIGKFLNDVCNLVETKKTSDIVDISNQSSKEGIRIVIEVKTLLKKEQDKKEIQEGLIKACDVIDLIIEILRGSSSIRDAKECLTTGATEKIKFKLKRSEKMASMLRFTDRQAQAILEMRLYKLIGLEIEALMKEHETTLANIAKYEDILNNYDSMAQVIIDDLDALKKEYAVKRKTKIENAEEAVFEENKVQEQEVVLLMDRFGYAKTVDGSVYERNREAADKENKYILRCMNTGKLCLFTSDGKMHQIKVMDLPYGKFRDKGFPIDNVSNFDSTKEEIVYLCDDRELFFSKFLFVTKQGMIKKVAGSEFQVTKRTIAATKLQDEDALVSIRPIRDVQDVVLMTENGFVLRFPAEEVSEKKKGAVGVRGMKLQKNDSVEEVYLFEEGTESKVIFHEKEVTLNRLKRAKRDGTGTRMRK